MIDKYRSITETGDRLKLQRCIASILDHPSVYMGGPSRGSIQKADRIIEFLEEEGYITLAYTHLVEVKKQICVKCGATVEEIAEGQECPRKTDADLRRY